MSSDFTMPGAERHYPPDLGIEPKHLDIRLFFDIDAHHASGKVIKTVVANRDGVTRLVLDAVDLQDLTVAGSDGDEIYWQYDGSKITIDWAKAFDRGEQRQVSLSYSVTHPVAGLLFGVPDAEYPDRARWAATDHETERARYWLPCVDQPAVRPRLDIHLTGAEHMTLLANGLLSAEVTNGDGTKTAHWHLDYPCPSYLLCFAVGEFVRADDEAVQGREIAYFGAVGRTTPEDLQRSFGRSPEIMRWMIKRFGVDFPFDKYFQFALPTIGGAMENISLVSWDDTFVVDETYASDIGELVELINVHEMAHSYFGDAVVCRDFAHAWLKESWAVYTEVLWYEDKYGDDDARYKLFRSARDYMGEADERYTRPIMTRVFNSSWDLYDQHLYPGGACRIHMLRRMLGDDVFFAAVTDYLQRFSKGLVETDDFRLLLERHSGRSLGRFFDMWIHGKGYPKLSLTFSFDKEKEEGTFTLEQTQVPERGDNEETLPFAFDLEIAWEIEDGQWLQRTVEVERRQHQYLFAMTERPRQICLDPQGSLLFRARFHPSDDMLRRAVRHAPDVVSRIVAAEELAGTNTSQNLKAVADAFAEESYYGVRQVMASLIAESKVAAAIPYLVSFLADEEHPEVLWTIASRIGEYRDTRVVEALRARLNGDLTYRVRAEIMAALGAQRGTADLDQLRDAAGDDGYRSLVRGGALRALASTRTEEGFETLLTRNGYGRETDDASWAAAGALGGATEFLGSASRARAVERLRDLLRDPREKVRRAAIGGLARLRATEAAGDVEKCLGTFAKQYHPPLQRMLQTIRAGAGDPAASAKLKKSVERLEAENRRLEARIDGLESHGDDNA
jgi:aminopeptidase N